MGRLGAKDRVPLNDRLLARLTMSMPDVGVRLSGKLQARL